MIIGLVGAFGLSACALLLMPSIIGATGNMGRRHFELFAFAAAILFLPLMAFAAAISGRRKLVIGADGFTLATPWRTRRFVPYASLTKVVLEDRSVHLHINGQATPLKLICGGGGVKRIHGTELEIPARAIAHRLEEGRSRVMVSDRVAVRALVEPGGRRTDAWMRDLGRLDDGNASYRASAVPQSEFWQLLEDPRETAALRAGSALALRRRLGDEGRARIRVIAEACADAPLRRVLRATADSQQEDEHELAAALEEIEEEALAAAKRTRSSTSRG